MDLLHTISSRSVLLLHIPPTLLGFPPHSFRLRFFYIPFSSSRLLLVDLYVLHSSTSHTSEGVLEGRGRRVWSGTQWWRARWRDIVEQDTGPASHRTIVTTTSRPPASCTNSSYPFCVHLTSPRTSLKFTPDALYWNPIAITHTIASRASVVDLTSCSVVVYF
ncbi:hypothetical protein BDW22DRAFT_55622 [Trametopsis cervina]|nr:hypothetical protein BDW22DRAFT_55622 [Trametopsis cervina]